MNIIVGEEVEFGSLDQEYAWRRLNKTGNGKIVHGEYKYSSLLKIAFMLVFNVTAKSIFDFRSMGKG